MRRRVNVRLLLRSLAIVLALGIAVHLIHVGQARRNAAGLLRQAELAEESGQTARALTYYAHYFTQAPDDTDAQARYALALARTAATSQARSQTLLVLEGVLRRRPGRDDVRRAAVRLAVEQRRFADAARHLRVLIAAAPASGDLEHQLGWCLEAQGKYADAAAAFGRAVAKAPNRVESYALLAELLLRRLDRADEAAATLDAMVQANPDDHRALLTRARFRAGRGDPAGAEEDVRRASLLSPDAAEVFLIAADLAVARGDAAGAVEALRAGRARHAADARFPRALATLETRAGRLAEALAVLRDALKLTPNAADLLLMQGELQADRGDFRGVADTLQRLRTAAPASAMPDYLRARVLMGRAQWAEACELLEQVRPRVVPATRESAAVDVALGHCYAAQGETEQELAAWRRAVEADPSLPAARLGLGAALLAAGEPDEAAVQLRQVAATEAPAPEVWLPLGRAAVRLAANQPEGRRDWSEAEAVLAHARECLPTSPQPAMLEAELLAARGEFARAAEVLRSARTRYPEEAAVYTALADVARQRGDRAGAEEILRDASRRLGDPLEVRLARVRLASSLAPEEARRALHRITTEPAATLSPAEQRRLNRQLADAFYRAGDRDEAARLWAHLAAEQPRDLRSRALLLELALQPAADGAAQQARDRETARLLAEMRRADGPDGVLWRAAEVTRAVALARRGDRSHLADARARLEEIRDRQREWGRADLLEAAIHELEGRPDQAADSYQRALANGERQPAMLARLARLLYDRRRVVEADQAVRVLEAQGPLPPAVARIAAEMALLNSDPVRGLTMARAAVVPGTRDYRDHIWLAEVLAACGRQAEADEVLCAAAATLGRVPDVWLAWVRHLARSGRVEAARAVLDEARERLPPGRAASALARGHEALGEVDRAEAILREAAAVRPADFVALRELTEFYRRHDRDRDAEPWLRALADPETGAPEEVAARARRDLALALAEDPRRADDALALLALNTPATPEDARARLLVLTSRPRLARESFRALEEARHTQTFSGEELYRLARAYERAGRPAHARDAMLGLLAAHRNEPRYLAHHIRQLIRGGEFDEARLYFSRLEALDPHAPRTRELREALRGR